MTLSGYNLSNRFVAAFSFCPSKQVYPFRMLITLQKPHFEKSRHHADFDWFSFPKRLYMQVVQFVLPLFVQIFQIFLCFLAGFLPSRDTFLSGLELYEIVEFYSSPIPLYTETSKSKTPQKQGGIQNDR